MISAFRDGSGLLFSTESRIGGLLRSHSASKLKLSLIAVVELSSQATICDLTSMPVSGKSRCYAFIFPHFVGHINPSLPLARRLVEEGHAVHYVCHKDARAKIEDTGATFHGVADVEPELYKDQSMDFGGMLGDMCSEFDLDMTKPCTTLWALKWLMLERQLPGLLRLLKELMPHAVVYCPERSFEGCMAAQVLGLPRVALITFAGPAAAGEQQLTSMEVEGTDLGDFHSMLCQWQPHVQAVDRLNKCYGLSLRYGLPEVRGVLEGIERSSLSLTTTSEDLLEPMGPYLQVAYSLACPATAFVAVGPLLHQNPTSAISKDDSTRSPSEILFRVRAARDVGRQIVLVSMGTVVTSDLPTWGWEGRQLNRDGELFGLTGRELCHAAWQAAFDEFGAKSPDEGALIVVALGPQANPLENISPPPNAICASFLPQVDVLTSGVDVFLTHGGQNSFTEALVTSTPVVVCPCFADQHKNAARAEMLGVGHQVFRPYPLAEEAAAACAAHRSRVARALREVAYHPFLRTSYWS